MEQSSIGTPLLWVGFTAFVLAMLALDLGVFHKKAREVHVGEALVSSLIWIALAVGFNAGVYFLFGREPGLEFLTSYVVEKALSVDNVFVFVVLLSAFAVPKDLQHRVLFWGVLGALVMRAIFIAAGAALLHRFHWVIFPLGAFLAYTGVKMLGGSGGEPSPQKNPAFRFFKRVVPSVKDFRGSRFTVVEDGKRYATPLLLVLVAIELSDIMFAVDSIPAIFAITDDPFIVYTSNIFALLGLRSLYFVLGGMITKFRYLKAGLALILAFVGGKMLVSGIHKVSIGVSLGVIGTLLGGSIILSLLHPRGGSGHASPGAA